MARPLLAGPLAGADPDPGQHASWIVLRVLEEGHSEEVRQLFARYGTALPAQLVRRRGGRQLSRRSLALWSLVLGVEPAPATAVAEALWSL